MNYLHPAPGSPPAILTQHAGREQKPPVIRLAEYNQSHLDRRQVSSVADLPTPQADGPFLWIEMNGLGDVEALRALGDKFDLHPLALEDVVNTGQRPKFELYDQHAFVIAQMIYQDDNRVCIHEQVSMFIFRRLLITVQEEDTHDVFGPVRERLQAGRGAIRKTGPDYLAYALLDAIIDHLFPLLEDLGAEIEEMESLLFEKPNATDARRIHDLKRTLMKFRRAVWPERDVVSAMLHDESGFISKTTKVYLRDCYDHTVQIMDLVESYRDVASGLMELYLSAVGMRTNEIMRVLTVVSAIFIPLTFIAGLYGMNFDWDGGKNPLNMPELHWAHGYVGCIVVMALAAIGEIAFFKKKGWL
jgi:magnesium transporter